MISHPSDRPVSPRRARMIEDMRVRGLSEKTRNDYIRNVRAFAAFIRRSPDTATAEDLRRFQHHQAQTGVRPPSINSAVAALRFFFTVTLDRPDLARRLTIVREPRRLPGVLSVEEVRLLFAAAPGPKYKAAFATAGACPGEGRRVPDCASPRSSRSRSAMSTASACCCGSSRARGARACPRESGGPSRHAVAAAARTAARLVAGGPASGHVAAARLAVSRPQSGRAALDAPARSRRPCRGRGRRDQEARVAAHAAAQLRHASAGTGH